MGTELQTQQRSELAPPSLRETPTEQLIRIALDKGQTPTELYAILREERAHQAEAAFNMSFATFQANRPRVIKRHTNAQFKVNRNGVQRSSMYADKTDIMDAVGPTLAENGLSVDWGTPTISGEFIHVPFIVRHVAGHSKTTVYPFPMAPDSRNTAPNPQQRWASVLSYAERYAMKSGLGITEADEDDDDAQAAGEQKKISDEQFRELNDALIQVQANVPAFLGIYKIDKLSDLPASKFDEAWKRIDEKKAKLGAKK